MKPTHIPPLLILVACLGSPAARADQVGLELFERNIRPVLVEHCYKCHSSEAKKPRGGLLLDTAAGIRKGGDSGSVIAPGRPAESLLLDAVSYAGDATEMPPAGKLPERVLADLRKWIELGAPLPVEANTGRSSPSAVPDMEEGRRFWSFRPPRRHAPSDVSDASWPRTKSNYFVLQRLDERSMRPSPPADQPTLLRRVAIDLLGLPPTYGEVEAFQSDPAPDAYARLVDRLLASPRYGERWGRHWLDVARYAEDNPTSEQTCKPPRFPYRYRDWVIRAFNDDLTYDEFVRRQLAADLMDSLPPSEIAALGFLGLSPVYHKEPKLSKEVISVIVADEWDERLDTVTRGLLGLTVACARCHDHKYDPIKMTDYYALAGVMASTQLVEWPLVEIDAKQAEALTEVRRQIVDFQLRLNYAQKMRQTALAENEATATYDKSIAELEATLQRLKNTKLFDGPIANAVRDAGQWINGDNPTWTTLDFRPGVPRDLPVFLRGSVTTPGEPAPRRFLEVFSPGGENVFRHGSGHLELAECILDDAGGLASRMIVNRVWGWHFGRPLVATPSNFGQLGERPSHPRLLDDLAARFIDSGWSMKWLHREILLSATYRQSSHSNETFQETDPDNRLLWKMNRRRLDVEAWRDAVLSVSRQLDHAQGGPSASLDDPANRRRTVYGTVSRQRPADVQRLFDFPDVKRHVALRMMTTTPLQQLYLLNSTFLHQQAATLAEDVVGQCAGDPRRIVRSMFRRVLLREPTTDEMRKALRLASDDAGALHLDNWKILAHGLLASNEFMFLD